MVSDTIESVCTQCVHFHSVLWIYIYSRIHMSARCRGRACARAQLLAHQWFEIIEMSQRVWFAIYRHIIECRFRDGQFICSAFSTFKNSIRHEKFAGAEERERNIAHRKTSTNQSLRFTTESSTHSLWAWNQVSCMVHRNKIAYRSNSGSCFFYLLFQFICCFFFVFHWLFFFLSLVFWILFGIIFCLKCACLHSAIMYTNQIRKACNNQLVFCFYFQHWFVLWNLNGHWKCTIRDRASE